jgi:hypothetical protein
MTRALIRAAADLFETIRVGLCKLNEIQFDAPWRAPRRRC